MKEKIFQKFHLKMKKIFLAILTDDEFFSISFFFKKSFSLKSFNNFDVKNSVFNKNRF